ncbi:MAG TPA: hypothetical protein VF503_19075 [Sphingobium sp.]|uniref:hypothetical protein n=1 Tax=Sphingobium sp. TaxID=1912891 RepID=UPI002ECFB2F9
MRGWGNLGGERQARYGQGFVAINDLADAGRGIGSVSCRRPAAIRQPSDRMQDAAYQFERSGSGDGKLRDASAVNVYQAIIDAALDEGE